MSIRIYFKIFLTSSLLSIWSESLEMFSSKPELLNVFRFAIHITKKRRPFFVQMKPAIVNYLTLNYQLKKKSSPYKNQRDDCWFWLPLDLVLDCQYGYDLRCVILARAFDSLDKSKLCFTFPWWWAVYASVLWEMYKWMYEWMHEWMYDFWKGISSSDCFSPSSCVSKSYFHFWVIQFDFETGNIVINTVAIMLLGFP